MAKVVKKEEVGFYDSVALGAESRDEISREKLPDTVWGSFKRLFSEKMSSLTKLGIITLLFCLPIIVWSFIVAYIELPISSTISYAGNLGPSFGFVTDATSVGNYLGYTNAMLYYSVMIACIIIASLAIGALMYVARLLLWTDEQRMFSSFFEGLKITWKSSLIAGALSGAAFFLLIFNLYVYDAYAIETSYKIAGIVSSAVLFAFVAIFSVYFVSLKANYKISLADQIISSLKLTVGRFVPNIFMVIFGGLMALLCWLIAAYASTFATMAYAIFIFYGLYYSVAVVTVNTHRQFDNLITSAEVSVSTAPVYAKKAESAEVAEDKKKNVQYTNPKKGKKKAVDGTESPVNAIPDNVVGGENGLEEDLSVYMDEDED